MEQPDRVPSAGVIRGSSAFRSGCSWRSVMTIVGIAVVGAAVRVAALLPVGAPDQFPVDYDEGVYSAAASLLAHGQWPYRDFVFVHPPGVLYALLPLGGLNPHAALIAARFVMVAAGTLCILLVGLIACRRWGLLAGAVGATVYASFPEVVQADHGVFLEPLLNLFCLAALTCWLHIDSPTRQVLRWDRWALAAGALAAAAVTVKLWAVFAVAAMLAVPPTRDRARTYRAFLVGLLVTGLLLWAPVLIGARSAVIEQALLFQIDRPGDGTATLTGRIGSILGPPFHPWQARHLAATSLALLGIVVILGWRRGDRLGRIAILWWLVTVASFLAAATYWDQYNAALAPSMSLLAAAAVSWVAPAWRRPGAARSAAVAAVVVTLLVITVSVRRSLVEITSRSSDLADTAADIAASVPVGECVTAFEPQWLLAADRLPSTTSNTVLSVDPYAAHLALIQQRIDLVVPSTAAAFADQPTDDGILESLSTCRYLLLGGRGHWQLSSDQQAWVTAHYRPLPHTGPIDLWERQDG